MKCWHQNSFNLGNVDKLPCQNWEMHLLAKVDVGAWNELGNNLHRKGNSTNLSYLAYAHIFPKLLWQGNNHKRIWG